MINKNIIFSIAVDGSSASGKTTGSKFISNKFNFKLLSSGKLYRYLAYKIIKNNFKYDKKFIKKQSKKITLKKLNSKKLYSPEITNLTSIIAKKKFIRTALRQFQIDFINKNKKVIVEGRDIASRIMPDADLKIFFKCSIKEKAKRRLEEFKKTNKKIDQSWMDTTSVYCVLVVQHLVLVIGGMGINIWDLRYCYKLIDG